MYYVINPNTFEIVASEIARPPSGWYGQNIVVYSEEHHDLDEIVDPDTICSRRISASPDVIAANEVDAAVIEISDYGKTVEVDIAGTVQVFVLVDNQCSFELISDTPGSNIEIKGINGKLAICSTKVYAR